MFFHRNRELPLPLPTVRDALRQQLRVVLPRGWIRDDRFRLYKTVANARSNQYWTIVITGEFFETANGTQLHYRVRPSAGFFIPAAIFSIPILRHIPKLFESSPNLLFFFSLCIPLLILGVSVWWQAQTILERFETKLNTLAANPQGE